MEDQPLDYGHFKGTIPKGEYGGGTVMLRDRGYWEPKGASRPRPPCSGNHSVEAQGRRSSMSPQPAFLPPQLCKSQDRAPSGSGWLHEIKFKDYRIQMRVFVDVR